MKKTSPHKWFMIYTQSLLLVAIGAVFLTESVCASLGREPHSLPAEKDLVQLRAGSHIMGFSPSKVYLVNTAGFLSVDFLDSRAVAPLVTTGKTLDQEDNSTQQGSDTIASLQRVEYPEIWAGISLHYDAVSNGIAESSYFIQPGADVADIRFRYNGDTQLQRNGSLQINLPTQQGYISESRPVAWQVIDGRKKPVQVAYHIQDQTIGFRIGAYDKDHELIIDPTYQWHSFFGSASGDYIDAMAVDGSGNVYVTGESRATWDGPGSASPINAFGGGNADIVVIKLNSAGAYQWHTFHGSASGDYPHAIALDSLNNVYVTGYSGETWDGPGAVSPIDPYNGGYRDILVVKLNSDGAYQWHTFHGTDWWQEESRGVAVDSNNNVYVTASSYSFNGPAGQAPLNEPAGNYSFSFAVIKLNSSGVYQWHTFYGHPDNMDQDFGIASDSDDKLYVTGQSHATWDGPDSGSGSVSPIHAHSGGGVPEIVIFKLDSDGAYQWHTFYGTDSYDEGHGIALDGSNNVCVVGSSNVTWDGPSGEAPVHAHNDNNTIVVLKLDSNGVYQWHTFHGSESSERGEDIAIDSSNNIYVVGSSSGDWPSLSSPVNPHNDGQDITVFKLNSSGDYQWHSFYGSTLTDEGYGIGIDSSKSIYVGGYSQETWDGPGSTAPLNSFSADADILVFKLNNKSTLTVNKKGSGIVTSTLTGIDCGLDCTEIYNDDTDVTLTALADADDGFVFSRWTGDCSGTDSTTTVKINGDKTCSALFQTPFSWPMFLPTIIYNAMH